MNNRSNAAAIVSYFTWVGFIIAIIIGDKSDSFTLHHLNQSLMINILSIVGGALAIIPILGSIASWVISLAVFAFWCMGVYRAITWSTAPLPVIGEFHLIG